MELLERARLGAVVARNVVMGANLRSLRLIGSPRRLYSYATESLFLYMASEGKRGLKEANPLQALGGGATEAVTLANLDESLWQNGWLQHNATLYVDLVNLCLLCRIVKPRVVFEIGTFAGYTALHLALNAPEAKVHTLDLLQDDDVQPMLSTTVADDDLIRVHRGVQRYCFDGTASAERIVRLQGDSATFDFGPYHGAVDLFFIDGAHTYDYVRSDTLAAMRCVRDGGVIAWHDFGRAGTNGVSRWLKELARDRAVYAVPGGSLAFMPVDARGWSIPHASRPAMSPGWSKRL